MTKHTKRIYTPKKVGASPAKFGIAPNTPLTQFHLDTYTLSGPIDGCNSLLMAPSDLDAISALKDLSNSAPPTPSKFLLQPRENYTESVPFDHDGTDHEIVAIEPVVEKPKTSLLSKVKAKVEEKESKRSRMD